MKKVIAVILGGGQGKRLFPLTKYRSKPAVPIGGKYRLIDIPISNCLHSGLKDIYVLTQFNSESLNNHIHNTYRFDYFSRAFIRILAAEQTVDNVNWYQGTADAVRKSMGHLDLEADDDILILSGDQLYRMDYRDLIQHHRRCKADFTVTAVPIKKNEARHFGILNVDKKNRIVDFMEKPKGSLIKASYLASAGVYLFKAKVLMKVLGGNDTDFGKEVIPHSIKTAAAYAYRFDGYWKDIGTIKAFYDVHIDFTSSKTHFSFFIGDTVFTRPRFLPPAKIIDSSIHNSLLAEGCCIEKSTIRQSVIGLRTIIGKNCGISRTVIMGADYYEKSRTPQCIALGIGDGTVIERAIVDKNVRIGRKVVIKNLKNLENFDSQHYCIRNRIVIIPKNTVIPDGSKI